MKNSFLEDKMIKFKSMILKPVISYFFPKYAKYFTDPENIIDGRCFEKTGGFSRIVPELWEIHKIPKVKYKSLLEPTENRFDPNIVFHDDNLNMTLNEYIHENIKTLEENSVEFKIIQRNEFETIKNLKGERLVTNYMDHDNYFYRQLFYFFPGKIRGQFLITCTSLQVPLSLVIQVRRRREPLIRA